MRSFIVRPHAQNLDGFLVLQHFVNKAVLNVDPTQKGTRQVAHQFFIGRRILKRVFLDDGQQFLGFGLQLTCSEFLRILLCMLGKNYLPTHQSSSLAQASTGSLIPSLRVSRMPRTDSR